MRSSGLKLDRINAAKDGEPLNLQRVTVNKGKIIDTNVRTECDEPRHTIPSG